MSKPIDILIEDVPDGQQTMVTVRTCGRVTPYNHPSRYADCLVDKLLNVYGSDAYNVKVIDKRAWQPDGKRLSH